MNMKFYKNKKKILVISMIPYPSGSLHIGHIRNYSINDIFCRFLLINKYYLFMPMGWDSFGLPAENASITNNTTPFKWIKKNIFYMKKQLKFLNFIIDWNKELITCDLYYYKWNQFIFLKLLKGNLIYLIKNNVNWDFSDKTILSNEQVINEKGWRSGCSVKKKFLLTYYVKLTYYKFELLNEIININWPKKVKLMQYNWLGKIILINYKFFFYIFNFKFLVNFLSKNLFMILNISIVFIDKFTINFKNILNFYFNLNFFYIKKLANIFVNKNICKFFYLSFFFFNDLNFKNYEILLNLKKFKLKKNKIIYNKIFFLNFKLKFIKNFFLNKLKKFNLIYKIYNFNYLFFSNLDLNFFLKKILKFRYFNKWNIKDWNISRQRYWGTPIPICICENCGYKSKSIKDLPFILPQRLKSNLNINCLIYNKYFINYKCKFCNINNQLKEIDTIDTFFDSSWYFLKYIFKHSKKFINKYHNLWFPLDYYIGGIEHSILHLLYTRFLIKFIRDKKFINFGEPVKNLFTQGLILNKTYYFINDLGLKIWCKKKDVKKIIIEKKKIVYINKINKSIVYLGELEKMSKSKNNGIDPSYILKFYNSDELKLYIISNNNINKNIIWKKKNLKYIKKFLFKFFKLFLKNNLKNYKFIFCNNLITLNDKLFIIFNYKFLKIFKFYYKNFNYNLIFVVFKKLLINFKNLLIKNILILNEYLSFIIRIIYPLIPNLTKILWNILNYYKNLNYIKNTFWPYLFFDNINFFTKKFLLINNRKLGLFLIKKNNKFYFKNKLKLIIFFKLNFLKKFNFKIYYINKNLVNINIFI